MPIYVYKFESNFYTSINIRFIEIRFENYKFLHNSSLFNILKMSVQIYSNLYETFNKVENNRINPLY